MKREESREQLNLLGQLTATLNRIKIAQAKDISDLQNLHGGLCVFKSMFKEEGLQKKVDGLLKKIKGIGKEVEE